MLGGGPAGSAAATLLARRSHDVALVRPRNTPAGELAASVPPSARKLLAELGFLESIENAGFFPNGGNTVWWAERPIRDEHFAQGDHGFHVTRRALEDVLVSSAESIGVTVYDGSLARSAKETGSGWRVRCEGADGSAFELTSSWILDATGRRGLLARQEGRKPDPSTTTLVLLGRWHRNDGWAAATRTHTLVESYSDGWVWSLPLDPQTRCFTAMIDQRETDLEGKDVREMLVDELSKAPHLAPLLKGAAPVGEGWACPASLYTASRFGRPGLLLVGDAGSFIDPLSSYGIKKALSSGWLAGVTTHTALVDAPMTEAAVEFFDTREREVYQSYRRISAAFFEEAAEVHETPYWKERAAAARRAGGSPGSSHSAGLGPAPDEGPAAPPQIPDDEVRAAFAEIRGQELFQARRGSSLRSIDRAAIESQRIVRDVHLASDRYPHGIRYYRDVDLRRIVEDAPQHTDVPELWKAYNQSGTPANLPDFLAALAAAFAAGFLEHESAQV